MNRRIDDQQSSLQILRRKNCIYEDGLLSMRNLMLNASPAVTASPPGQGSGGSSSTAMALQPPSEEPPFESATHHLLSLHESLREEVDRVSTAVADLDARSSMMILNESLRLKEDMAHTNAAITSMRAHLQWLMSARLQQVQPRNPNAPGSPSMVGTVSAEVGSLSTVVGLGQPIRRLSDLSRQDTKL